MACHALAARSAYRPRQTRLPSAAGPDVPAAIYGDGSCAASWPAAFAGLEDTAWFCFNGDFGKCQWQVPF